MNSCVEIRPVEAKDAESICRIYNPYILTTDISFEEQAVSVEQMQQRIESIIRCNACPYIVAEVDGLIVGYAYAHPWKERAAYGTTLETTIYLVPEAKGRGIGKLLMQRLIDECRSRGSKVLIACITATNVESIAFHSQLGFRRVSHFEKVGYKFGQWLDVVDMELIL